MSKITNLRVNLYSTQEEPINPVNPDIPDTGDPDTGLFTVLDVTNGQDGTNIDIAPIAFTAFVLLIVVAFVLPKLIKKIHRKDSERYDLNSKGFRNFRFLSTILASFSLLIGLVSTAMGYVPQKVDNLPIDAAKKVTIDAPILDTNDIAVVHSTVKIPAGSGDNTKLYITSTSSDLVDIHNPAHKIPSITEKGTLQDNTYGIYVGKNKPAADSEFYPVYSDDKGIYSLFQADPNKETTVDIWYGVRSKSNKATTYETNLTVEALSVGRYTLQEMTPELCASFEQGIYDLYEMYDSRDGKVYGVARYEDGNCWMVSTLDLDLSTGTTLTSADTNLPEGTTYTPNTNTTTNIEIWEYANPFSDEYKPKLMEYTRLRLNLISAECNEDNERWCKEEGEEGYDEWMSTKNYISDLITGSYPYVWDKNSTIDPWFPLTEEDIVFLREKLLDFFGVEELTEKEKQWNNSFNDVINNSARNVLIHKWDEFWQGDCNAITAGDEFADADNYKSWCREQVDRYTTLLYDEAFKSGEYKDFPHYSLDTTNQADGNYYNLLSATAGTFEIHYNTPSAENDYDSSAYYTTSGSICPANWHLATKTDFKHILSANKVQVVNESDGMTVYDKKLSASSNFLTNNGFYLAVDDDDFFGSLRDLFPAPGIHKEISIPDEYVEQIGLSHATIESLSNIGYYIEMDVAGGGSQVQSLSDYNTMFRNGLSVRCVADGEFSLSFDGNSDSDVANLPETKKIKKTEENEETGVTFTIPDTIPTRAGGVKFAGWATSKTNAANFIIDYLPGDEITVLGMITLYAVWDIETPYPTPKAIHTEDNSLVFVYDKKNYAKGSQIKTHDNEQSKITEVFTDFDYETLEEGIKSLDDLGADGGLVRLASYTPVWSSAHNATREEDLLKGSYASYIINDSFKAYKPEKTQFWFFPSMNVVEGEASKVDFTGLENIDTSEVTNMVGMFFMCMTDGGEDQKGLSFDLSSWDVSKVEYMDGLFAGLLVEGPFEELKGLDTWNTESLKSANLMFSFFLAANDTIEIDFSNWKTDKLESISDMFYGTGLWGDDSGTTNRLKVSGIEHWNTPSLKDISGAFHGAFISKDSLNLSGWDVSKVTNMHATFSNLSTEQIEGETRTLNLYGWDTSNVTDMSSMFGNANESSSSLEIGHGSHVDVINLNCYKESDSLKGCDEAFWNTENVTDMTKMFSRGDYATIYSSKDWSNKDIPATDMFYKSTNLKGGAGTAYSDSKRSIAYARPDGGTSAGYFTNPYATTADNSNSGASSGNSISPAPISGNSINPTYTPSIVEPTEPTTTPNSTNPQDGNTEPYGVIRKAKTTDKTDYALIIVTIISIALILLGALIIFLIEKRERDEDDDIEEY